MSTLFLGVLFLLFQVLNFLFPLDLKLLYPQPATQILDSQHHPLRFFLSPDQSWRFKTEETDISPVLKQVILASEDRWFYWHPGINPLAVLRAAWSNLWAGRTLSGASTINMQLARLMHPRRRIFSSKLIEAFRALQIEYYLSKNEILMRYLNLAPFGGNIVGIEAASWFYFGKNPKYLSLGECALLTALPRSPIAYNPIKHPQAAKKVRNRILTSPALQRFFTPDKIKHALQEPLPIKLNALPMNAPHFCEMIYRQLGRGKFLTTLELDLQLAARSRFKTYMNQLRVLGIEDGACVILDRKTSSIKALIGSADYFDAKHHGQINAALALRSPGSTLKPFLYAQAFDLGIIVPQTKLLDIPCDFSGYSPQNYDEQYRGAVTASYALAHSLNVPAVKLLKKVGLKDFHSLLKRGGLDSLHHDASYYGLPLVLGACETSLLQLANLYAALGRGGRFIPWNIEEKMMSTNQLFSEAACFLTSEILVTVKRPDMGHSWDLTVDTPRIAWKTGTSFGHRDAWAIGFNNKYIIGVWVGNLNGQAVQGISGANHAGPLLFDLFRAVQIEKQSLVLIPPDKLVEFPVCTISGLRATTLCPHTKIVKGIQDRLPPRCFWHKRIFVDSQTGDRLAGSCTQSRDFQPKIVTVYPQELAGWRKEQGLEIYDLPRLSPFCLDVLPGQGPLIISPSESTPYVLRQGIPIKYQQLPLIVRAGADVDQVYWFIDGKLIAQGTPDKKYFIPLDPGQHQAVAQDNLGRVSSVDFSVE